ncbi:MAG: type II toxin-antitoxin system death-on-curing family toxin [Sandaracinaceae bacterium]|nr:type II toxin-antitoxin system death-on-curing family toxin [Sandaracinaceae bacterium]
MTVRYLSTAQIRALHRLQVERFGGATGLRDEGALDAAVMRARASFGGEDLYADLPAKAAALMHSLVQNHPFVDGNKRVGLHAMLVFLAENGVELDAGARELVEVTLAVASSRLGAEALTIWIRQRIKERAE